MSKFISFPYVKYSSETLETNFQSTPLVHSPPPLLCAVPLFVSILFGFFAVYCFPASHPLSHHTSSSPPLRVAQLLFYASILLDLHCISSMQPRLTLSSPPLFSQGFPVDRSTVRPLHHSRLSPPNLPRVSSFQFSSSLFYLVQALAGFADGDYSTHRSKICFDNMMVHYSVQSVRSNSAE